MKDKLIDVIGMIDENKIREAKSAVAKVCKFSYKKAIAIIAAAAFCMTMSVPAISAATEIELVYQMVYNISPTLAQKLKPIRMSCEDQGIKMEVESAYIYENEAHIIVSMQDLEGDRIDVTTDLYDSYDINTPFDAMGTCSQVDYDEKTGKATFLIKISLWDDKDISGDKITFSVGEFLSHKKIFEDEISIDLSSLDVITKTQNQTAYSFDGKQEEQWQEPCIIPNHSYEDFIDGIDLTGYGYIDGKFHIQVAIKDRLDNDNHGGFYLVGKNGNTKDCEYSVDWKDKNNKRVEYFEYVFDISQEEIQNYELYGYFVTSEGSTKGNWQVTFPLENMN